MIRVFGQTDKTFTSNGDIVLKPLKAKVHKKDNGDYYLELETDLSYIDYVVEGNIVVANTPTGDQAFRISNVTKSKNKIVSKCFHVFYDSKNYLITGANVMEQSCADALTILNSATEPQTEFVTSSDIETAESYTCARKSLYEALQDVISIWGGHLVRDNFSISIKSSIGTDNGIVVQYKKNLKDITCKENWSNVVTKLMPIGKDGILLNDLDPTASPYLVSATQYDIPYCKAVIFQQNINQQDYASETLYKQALIDDLRAQGQDYLDINCLPQINYTLKANLDRVTDIGDTVEVIDERLGVDLITNVIGFVYDCIFGQYTEVEFGNFVQTLNGLVSTMNKSAEKIATETVQDQIATTLSDYILTRGTTDGWSWRKYASGVVEAWKQVTVNASDVSWSSFLSIYSGYADVSYPFTISNAVVTASMNDSGDIGWISSAKAEDTSKARLTIVRQGNSGTMTINVFVRGTGS